MPTMEQEIERITHAVFKEIGGANIGVVIGVGLNMLMTAAQQYPDSKIRRALAIQLVSIADSLQAQDGVKQ